MTDVEELAVHECWSLLRTARVGRLAVVVAGRPEILPINYLVDQGTLVLRTGERSMMANAASVDAEVAFEVDGVDSTHGNDQLLAWSVVVKGFAQTLKRLDEIVSAAQLPVLPWQSGLKPVVIRIEPTDVSGRRFPIADSGYWRNPLTAMPIG